MAKSLTEKINIYITVDLQTINSYFNSHDPSPLYKKQINQKFEQYLLNTVSSAKRYSAIFYKLNCPGSVNRQYAEPLMYAIHRHFAYKRDVKKEEFQKFKKRNYALLAISATIVIVLEAFLPLFLSHVAGSFYNGLKNCIDVFSWVILWKPIYELLFSWNPYLKEILLFKKLSTAEVIVIDDKKITEPETPVKIPARNETELKEKFSIEALLIN